MFVYVVVLWALKDRERKKERKRERKIDGGERGRCLCNNVFAPQSKTASRNRESFVIKRKDFFLVHDILLRCPEVHFRRVIKLCRIL